MNLSIFIRNFLIIGLFEEIHLNEYNIIDKNNFFYKFSLFKLSLLTRGQKVTEL